jgi:hypothetical protein
VPVASSASVSLAIEGKVERLQHCEGHASLLVKLAGVMIDPEGCGRTDCYILPDSAPRSAFVQAMILTAQATRRDISINLAGCQKGLAKIYRVEG